MLSFLLMENFNGGNSWSVPVYFCHGCPLYVVWEREKQSPGSAFFAPTSFMPGIVYQLKGQTGSVLDRCN